MSVKEPTPLEREILVFQDKVQRIVDNSLNFYESMMRDEEALKRLLDRVGEIPNKQRSRDEHKADT